MLAGGWGGGGGGREQPRLVGFGQRGPGSRTMFLLGLGAQARSFLGNESCVPPGGAALEASAVLPVQARPPPCPRECGRGGGGVCSLPSASPCRRSLTPQRVGHSRSAQCGGAELRCKQQGQPWASRPPRQTPRKCTLAGDPEISAGWVCCDLTGDSQLELQEGVSPVVAWPGEVVWSRIVRTGWGGWL